MSPSGVRIRLGRRRFPFTREFRVVYSAPLWRMARRSRLVQPPNLDELDSE